MKGERPETDRPPRDQDVRLLADSTGVEAERYELFAGPLYAFEGDSFTVDRRAFIKTFGAGLLVLVVAPRVAAAAESGGQESGRTRGGERMPDQVSAWLYIAENSSVTVFTGKTEIGQNIRTSLTQAVAEELKVPAASITLVMADTARTPFDMGTFGSRTTPTMNLQLRKAAAAAREALADRAAQRWGLNRQAITVADGRVRVTGAGLLQGSGELAGQSIAIGSLAAEGALVATIRDDVVLEPPKDWTVAGTSAPKVGGREFVTGRHRYTSDLVRDGMLHGRIVRPPAYGASLARVDASGASRLPGVVVVHDGDFLGVAAPTAARAAEAAAAIRAEWTGGSSASARTLFADLKAGAADLRSRAEGGAAPYVTGAVDAAFEGGELRSEADYTVAYIAHAPLEPRAAVAEWQTGQLTVWTGTQRPFGVQQELAEAFHLPSERVRVIVPDTGSAYGGKHTGEAAIEAARLARQAGRPVKLVWTREEEFARAYFRPAGVITVRAAARRDGTMTAWEFHNYNSGPAAIRTPYAIPNQRIVFHASASPLRQGSYRGLAATANHFARESHMDDLAGAAGLDPLAFRLKNLRDERLAAVLQAAAEAFGWRTRRQGQGHGSGGTVTGGTRPGDAGASPDARLGTGLACGVEKGGYTATCVEITMDRATGRITPARVVVAFECGAIVNPDGLRNQVEGAVIQGLGGALFEAVAFDGGMVTNGRFSQYRVPRFSDVPRIEVVLVSRPDLPPAGAGETPIVGIAPAIGNAIFDASGVRLRALPLIPHGLPASTAQA